MHKLILEIQQLERNLETSLRYIIIVIIIVGT
jgi:hypothetical protein